MAAGIYAFGDELYGDDAKTLPVKMPKGAVIGEEASVSVPALPVTLSKGNQRLFVYNPAGSGNVNLDDSYAQGDTVTIVNRSKAFTLTVKSDDGDTIDAVLGGHIKLVALQAAPTDATHWHVAEIECESDSIAPAGVSYIVTGGGAPSGDTHSMRWVRVGDRVTVYEHINWSGAGTAVTQIRFDIPAELPVPATGGTPLYAPGSALEIPGNTACGVYLDQSGAASQVHYLMAASNVTDIVGTYSYRV